MSKDSTLTWAEALQEFLLHKQAAFAKKTVRYYKVQLSGLAEWCSQNGIPFDAFAKRHLDRYLVFHAEKGVSQLTLHHDAICAKTFFTWCKKNDLIDRNPLGEYEVRNAPRPPKHMPTDQEIVALLEGINRYWSVTTNEEVRYNSPAKRQFHKTRNYALILGLLDTACRIGEMLSFKVDDYRQSEKRITIRESKGRESRTLPVSPEWAEALDAWLKLRAKVWQGASKDQDEGWLFMSETGGRLDEGRFLKTLKTYRQHAGIESPITLHSLRRYSLNKLAKKNLLAAQAIAGHKETKTTLLYTRIDPDFVRDAHSQAGVVRGIVKNRVYEQAKRRRLL